VESRWNKRETRWNKVNVLGVLLEYVCRCRQFPRWRSVIHASSWHRSVAEGRHCFHVSVTGERDTGNEKAVLRFPSEPLHKKPMMIRQNLVKLRESIEAAAGKAARNADEITLIGVSKTQPSAAIREAFDAGLRHFGENRVQEWEGKHTELQGLSATWHLIGHLQSNKAAKAAKLFHSVDSLDDWELAQRLNRAWAGKPAGETLRVLIEVHLGGEESKTGVAEEHLGELADQVATLDRLDFRGLFCIPPYQQDQEQIRPYFARLRRWRDGLEVRLGKKLPVLSMGMSHDFEAAIAEGATEVRVGTALFGARTVGREMQ
jgi:PLP dependent protein